MQDFHPSTDLYNEEHKDQEHITMQDQYNN